MVNRCDSVDALMYAYYEFMKNKEENQMLEKNKDYVEFTLQCTTVERSRDKDYREVCFNGYSDYDFPGVPMDVVCKEFNHKVVMMSKSDFDRLQADNKELKRKLHEFDPIPDYKELLKTLYSTEDVEKLEWTLNHICGGQASVNGWRASSKFWNGRYKDLLKLVGFSSKKEVEDYLVNDAECDTLHEAILKLKDQVKYTCDEWYSANSSNNSWKAAAECNSPKELIEKIERLEGKVKALETEAEVYSRAFQEWKEITGYPSPSAVKTALESGASWYHAYNETKKANEKLGDDLNSWKNVTGYSIPEDYLQARISGAFHTPFDYTAAWQTATGCDTPEQAKERIKALNERINELEADYNHLLCTTGFESEGEIEDALDKCDHSTLRKALVDYEFDYEELLKLTGYKSNQDIRVALNYSEQFVYETMRELINSLKRKAEFTESNWQHATGCDTPGAAEEIIQTWKDMTKCETPEAAATWITSYESACERGNELAEGAAEREKEWQDATGRVNPEAAKQYIDRLRGRLNKIHWDAVDW